MDKCLLDTDIFSEVLKGKNPAVLANATKYGAAFDRFTISSITVVEIVKGLRKRGSEERLQKFVNSLQSFEVLALETDAAILAGKIYGDLEKRGQPIGRADPMIAATALHHELPLNTGNTDHFERIRVAGYELHLLNWRT